MLRLTVPCLKSGSKTPCAVQLDKRKFHFAPRPPRPPLPPPLSSSSSSVFRAAEAVAASQIKICDTEGGREGSPGGSRKGGKRSPLKIKRLHSIHRGAHCLFLFPFVTVQSFNFLFSVGGRGRISYRAVTSAKRGGVGRLFLPNEKQVESIRGDEGRSRRVTVRSRF